MARWKRLLPERIYSRAIYVAERFGPCVDNTAMDSEILVGCFTLFPSTKAGPRGGGEGGSKLRLYFRFWANYLNNMIPDAWLSKI